MSVVFIALGSNLGDRHKNIKEAIDLLKENHVEIIKQSSLIETDPVGGPPQNKFINAVIKGETQISPYELLKITQEIEMTLKRERIIKDGPRTIDLDILLYDDLKVHTKELIIPHPRMFERPFVLKPLNEIAPEIINQHPYARHHLN